MKLIFCIADNNGMSLFGKRLSRDSVLTERLTELTSSSTLWMNSYSAKLFGEVGHIAVDENYLSKAGSDDYCFVENGDYTFDGVNEMIICRWNRDYPADRFLNIDIEKSGFVKDSSENILGSSHPLITIDTYTR